MVHRLVAFTFIGPPKEGEEVCHISGDHLDNRLENLRWGSHSSNILDQVRQGTHFHARKTHCKNGHELIGDNVRRVDRKRLCRACNIRNSAEYRERQRLLMTEPDDVDALVERLVNRYDDEEN